MRSCSAGSFRWVRYPPVVSVFARGSVGADARTAGREGGGGWLPVVLTLGSACLVAHFANL